MAKTGFPVALLIKKPGNLDNIDPKMPHFGTSSSLNIACCKMWILYCTPYINGSESNALSWNILALF